VSQFVISTDTQSNN